MRERACRLRSRRCELGARAGDDARRVCSSAMQPHRQRHHRTPAGMGEWCPGHTAPGAFSATPPNDERAGAPSSTHPPRECASCAGKCHCGSRGSNCGSSAYASCPGVLFTGCPGVLFTGCQFQFSYICGHHGAPQRPPPGPTFGVASSAGACAHGALRGARTNAAPWCCWHTSCGARL